MTMYPEPPEWVQPTVHVLVNVNDVDRDREGRTGLYGDDASADEITAVVMHVGDPRSGDRTAGPVYLRPLRGGREFTAPGTALRPATGS